MERENKSGNVSDEEHTGEGFRGQQGKIRKTKEKEMISAIMGISKCSESHCVCVCVCVCVFDWCLVKPDVKIESHLIEVNIFHSSYILLLGFISVSAYIIDIID